MTKNILNIIYNMVKFVCKFYKIDKFNNPCFIVGNKIDKYTFNLIEKVFGVEMDKYVNNPIFKKENNEDETYCYFVTCKLKEKYKFEKSEKYSFDVEFRVYEKKYINMWILTIPQKLKSSYEVLNFD